MDTLLRMCKLAAGAVLILILLGIGYLENESFYRSKIEQQLSTTLKASVEIKHLELELLSLKWLTEEVRITGPIGYDDLPALAAHKMELDVALLPYLFSDTIRFEKFIIEKPVVIFRGNLTDNNLRSLHHALETFDPQQNIHLPSPVAGKHPVQINRFILRGGEIRVISSDGLAEQVIPLGDYDIGPIGRGRELSWADLTEKGLNRLEYFIRPNL